MFGLGLFVGLGEAFVFGLGLFVGFGGGLSCLAWVFRGVGGSMFWWRRHPVSSIHPPSQCPKCKKSPSLQRSEGDFLWLRG